MSRSSHVSEYWLLDQDPRDDNQQFPMEKRPTHNRSLDVVTKSWTVSTAYRIRQWLFFLVRNLPLGRGSILKRLSG